MTLPAGGRGSGAEDDTGRFLRPPRPSVGEELTAHKDRVDYWHKTRNIGLTVAAVLLSVASGTIAYFSWETAKESHQTQLAALQAQREANEIIKDNAPDPDFDVADGSYEASPDGQSATIDITVRNLGRTATNIESGSLLYELVPTDGTDCGTGQLSFNDSIKQQLQNYRLEPGLSRVFHLTGVFVYWGSCPVATHRLEDYTATRNASIQVAVSTKGSAANIEHNEDHADLGFLPIDPRARINSIVIAPDPSRAAPVPTGTGTSPLEQQMCERAPVQSQLRVICDSVGYTSRG